MFLQPFAEQLWPVKINAKTAPAPEHEFYDPLDIDEIRRSLWVGFRKNFGREMKDRAIGLFERQRRWQRIPGRAHLLAKAPARQNRRTEFWIEHGNDFRLRQEQPVIFVDHRKGILR